MKRLCIKYERNDSGYFPFYTAFVVFKHRRLLVAYIQKSTTGAWTLDLLTEEDRASTVDILDTLAEAKERLEVLVYELILNYRRQLWPEKEDALYAKC